MTVLRPPAATVCLLTLLGCAPVVSAELDPQGSSSETTSPASSSSSTSGVPDDSTSSPTPNPGSTTSGASDTTSAEGSGTLASTTSLGSGTESESTSTGTVERCDSPFVDADDRLQLLGAYTRGNADGLITIVQWTGYNDPFSRNAFATMGALLEGPMGPEVRLVSKQLPLAFQDPEGRVARAALAAGELGSFWEMHDLLFQYEGELDDNAVDMLASELGLDLAAFHTAADSAAVAARIDADAELFEAVGGSGTPSSVINGEFVQGAQPLEVFEQRASAQLDAIQALIDSGFTRCEAFEMRLDAQLP